MDRKYWCYSSYLQFFVGSHLNVLIGLSKNCK